MQIYPFLVVLLINSAYNNNYIYSENRAATMSNYRDMIKKSECTEIYVSLLPTNSRTRQRKKKRFYITCKIFETFFVLTAIKIFVTQANIKNGIFVT